MLVLLAEGQLEEEHKLLTGMAWLVAAPEDYSTAELVAECRQDEEVAAEDSRQVEQVAAEDSRQDEQVAAEDSRQDEEVLAVDSMQDEEVLAVDSMQDEVPVAEEVLVEDNRRVEVAEGRTQAGLLVAVGTLG